MNKVAIIIVNYMGGQDTIECLQSLEKTTYADYEVYVVDNASTDDSVKRISEYCETCHIKVKLIESKENLGFAGGNNLALQEAIKEDFSYFLFLNNDTLVEKDFLRQLLIPFKTRQHVGATIGQIYYESNRKKIWYAGGKLDFRYMKPSHDRFDELEEKHYSEFKEVSFATGCCLCCSKECIELINSWVEDYFLYEEDVDMCIRIQQNSLKIVYNSDAVIYHKVSASTGRVGGLSQIYQVRNRLILLKRYLKRKDFTRAKIYTYFLFINRIRKKEYTIKEVIKGISAYRHGELGKHAK